MLPSDEAIRSKLVRTPGRKRGIARDAAPTSRRVANLGSPGCHAGVTRTIAGARRRSRPMLDEKVEPSFDEIMERVCEPGRQVIFRVPDANWGAVSRGVCAPGPWRPRA